LDSATTMLRFRFDRANRRLEDASGAIPLNPKAFDVLRGC
jgi:hypothetical protein